MFAIQSGFNQNALLKNENASRKREAVHYLGRDSRWQSIDLFGFEKDFVSCRVIR